MVGFDCVLIELDPVLRHSFSVERAVLHGLEFSDHSHEIFLKGGVHVKRLDFISPVARLLVGVILSDCGVA